MRKLWLVFAQAVTITLAALFVVSLVKPDWLAWRAQVVEVREATPPGATAPSQPVGNAARPLSFSDAAKKAIPSVVNISATRQVRRRNPLLEDPAFQRFFGERFSLPPETQLSLGSGVIVSRVFGGLDFSSYYLPLAGQAMGLPLAEARKLGAVFAYGNFLTVAVNFVILALIIFLMVKQINRLKADTPPAPAATPEDIALLREIRDSLKK